MITYAVDPKNDGIRQAVQVAVDLAVHVNTGQVQLYIGSLKIDIDRNNPCLRKVIRHLYREHLKNRRAAFVAQAGAIPVLTLPR